MTLEKTREIWTSNALVPSRNGTHTHTVSIGFKRTTHLFIASWESSDLSTAAPAAPGGKNPKQNQVPQRATLWRRNVGRQTAFEGKWGSAIDIQTLSNAIRLFISGEKEKKGLVIPTSNQVLRVWICDKFWSFFFSCISYQKLGCFLSFLLNTTVWKFDGTR